MITQKIDIIRAKMIRFSNSCDEQMRLSISNQNYKAEELE